MAAGAQLIVPAEANVDGILRTIEEVKVSVLATVPPTLPALVRGVREVRPDLGTLRTVLLAGGGGGPDQSARSGARDVRLRSGRVLRAP